MLTHSKNGQKNKLQSLSLHLLLAIICALCVMGLLLCFFGMLMCKVDIPVFLSIPLATVSACTAVFISAILFAYLQNEKGMLFGFVLGIILFALLCIATLICTDAEFTSLSTLKLIAFCTSGAIGGTVGILLKEKRRKIH